MTKIQYTIRNIPPAVDQALKARSKVTRKSFNQTVLDELSKNLIKDNRKSGRFDWLAGTMDKNEAQKFDRAVADLNRPDPEFWQ